MEPKRMEAVTVYISDSGYICLKNDDLGEGEQVVIFLPEQADLVIDWIKEAKETALIMREESE